MKVFANAKEAVMNKIQLRHVMALSITPTPLTGSFSDFTYNFILRSESLIRRIYTDGRGVPTLGVGYALVINVGGIWQLRDTLTADLASIGIGLTPTDQQINGQRS